MDDFFEIDFLDVEAKSSGDAIPCRYSVGGVMFIHVTDGGFQSTGDTLVEHINKYYDSPSFIDNVVVTHPDGDHAGGIRSLFEEFEIGSLWMLRPWEYAEELIDRFSRFTSVDGLRKRLKELYPNLVALEELADENGVEICEPFQGAGIGHFTVMAPTKASYLDLVVESDKTPEATKQAEASLVMKALAAIGNGMMTSVRALWGQESFPEDDTSDENNMSVVQYATLCGKTILLTGDAGRATWPAALYNYYLSLLPSSRRVFSMPASEVINCLWTRDCRRT